jgi:putative flippase GtrA
VADDPISPADNSISPADEAISPADDAISPADDRTSPADDAISLANDSNSPRAPSRTAVWVQFVKFGTVGVSNTLLTFIVYTLLLKVFGVWYLAASAIGFAVGATNGFLLNRRWTFRDHVGDSLTPVRWATVQGVGLGINEGLLYLLVDGASVDKLLAQAGATVVVTVSTFFANRAWTFRTHPLPDRQG